MALGGTSIAHHSESLNKPAAEHFDMYNGYFYNIDTRYAYKKEVPITLTQTRERERQYTTKHRINNLLLVIIW